MIIIVDAGSTKSHLKFIEGNSFETDIFLPGINPFYQGEGDIIELLKGIELKMEDVTNVFHFGAGCSFPEKKDIVKRAWLTVCKNADILVDTDMLGAAIALLGNGNGIACILGTGANSCLYRDGKIVKNVPPLGYILGDEGSGAYLGKSLIADCMKGILPDALSHAFYTEYGLTQQQVMDGVYKGQLPSRFLASFVPFIAKNLNTSVELQNLVLNSFRLFFKRNVLLYDRLPNCGLGFIGGVAKQFEEQLRIVALEFGFDNVRIMGDPMLGLVAYYKQKIFLS